MNGSFSTATREGTTFATLGQGDITIGGQTGDAIADRLEGLNRDLEEAQVITRDSSFSTGNLELDVGALGRARDNISTIARNISARREASQLDLEGENRDNFLSIRNAGLSAEAAQRIEQEGFLRAGSDAITALSSIGASPEIIEELLFEDGLGDQLRMLDHRTSTVIVSGLPDLGEPDITEPDEVLKNSNAGAIVLDVAGDGFNYIGELAQENPRKAQFAAFGLEFATNANPLVAAVKIIADEALEKAFGDQTQVFHEGASGFLTALANGHSLDVAIEIATNPESREAFLASGGEELETQFGGGQLVSNSILPGGADLVDLARGFARRGARGGADVGGVRTGNDVVDDFANSRKGDEPQTNLDSEAGNPVTLREQGHVFSGPEFEAEAAVIASRSPRQLSDGSIVDNHGFVYTRNANGSVTSRVATADQLVQSGIDLDFDNISTAKRNANPPQSPTPRNEAEIDAFDHIRANPSNGTRITRGEDARFAAGGFQKFQQKVPGPNGRNIDIHYQYNPNTGQVVDVKVNSSVRNSQ